MEYDYYRTLIDGPNRIRQESEEQFEKNIQFITSGGIVLAITYLQAVHTDLQKLDKDIPNLLFILCSVLGLLSLLASLILNLISHRRAIRNQEDNIKYITNNYITLSEHNNNHIPEVNEFLGKYQEKQDKQNKSMELFNKLSIVFLCVGVVLFVIFVFFNITTPNVSPKPE